MKATNEELLLFKDLFNTLDMYSFFEEAQDDLGRDVSYIGICADIEKDAHVYVYKDGEYVIINNSREHQLSEGKLEIIELFLMNKGFQRLDQTSINIKGGMTIQEVIDSLLNIPEEQRSTLPLYVCDTVTNDNSLVKSLSLFDDQLEHSQENILGLNY